MRIIKYIVLHCTATQPNATVEAIQNYWRNILHWKSPGYHHIIPANGIVKQLQPEDQIANGVAGYNANSIHISYVGGVDKNNVPTDTRTPEQLAAMKVLIKRLKAEYPSAAIQGHRDFPNVHKACPSFNVKLWISKEDL
jgi:N-acetylmuramoyl-L-alanine amidase